jgi:hypothetical protein
MVCGTPDPKNYKKLYNNVCASFISNGTPPKRCFRLSFLVEKSGLVLRGWKYEKNFVRQYQQRAYYYLVVQGLDTGGLPFRGLPYDLFCHTYEPI